MSEETKKDERELEQLEAEIWGERQAARQARSAREWVRLALRILGVLLIVLLSVGALCGSFYLGMLVERNTPVTTVMSLNEYYNSKESEVLILLDAERSEWIARDFGGEAYLPYEMVRELYLPRLYLDEYDQLVMLTTPTEVFCFPIESRAYTVNEQPAMWEVPVVRYREGQLWFSMSYLQQEVDLYASYTISEGEGAPGRLVLFTRNGAILQKEVRGATQVRNKADVKGDILKELSEGEKVWLLTGGVTERFDKVMTQDGVIGYVRTKLLGEARVMDLQFAERTKDLPEAYFSVEREEPVVMVWHQVFNETANGYLADKLAQAEGVNVVSPTWFSIENNNGRLTTLASHEYVETAHSMGIQVWPLINDFTEGLDYNRIFGSETCRRNLINNIFWFIYEYDLDGINIDFENITQENSRGYIQFLRELSVACRNEGIALSVDNYVPMDHTAHYDRAEQGVLADYVVVMAYDEHYAGSPVPGSVSSLSWVERGIEATMSVVPAEKLVVGLPMYTRLWKEQIAADGAYNLYSEALSMNAALNLVRQNGAELIWDETTGQYFASWQGGNTTYRIWLEEERSMGVKLDKAAEYEGLGGVAFWKLGLERAEVWEQIRSWKNGQ